MSETSGNNDFQELIERQKKGSLKIYLGYAAGVGQDLRYAQRRASLEKLGGPLMWCHRIRRAPRAPRNLGTRQGVRNSSAQTAPRRGA